MAEYEMEHKTASYVRRAQNNYLNKFDRITIRMPKGSSEIIKNTVGDSVNNYITQLIKKDLKETYGVEIE